MKIKMLSILIFWGLGSMLFPNMLAQIDGLAKPGYFAVNGDRLYIEDQDQISIYSMKDFKRIKQFGKKGEGPGEYRFLTPFKVYRDQITISTFGKVLFFTRDGEFIKEIKLDNPRLAGMTRLDGKYVGYKSTFNRETRDSTTITAIFDKDFKVIKELASWGRKFSLNMSGKFEFNAINDYKEFHVAGDKIFLADTAKGFFIEVLNAKGEKLYRVKKDHEELDVTQEWKDDYVERMKLNPNYRQFKDRVEYVFRDRFPAFKRFTVDGGKIYVTTYKTKDDKIEIIVMDLKGNVLKTAFITDNDKSAIHNGRFYYLKENEDEEEWELFAEDI